MTVESASLSAAASFRLENRGNAQLIIAKPEMSILEKSLGYRFFEKGIFSSSFPKSDWFHVNEAHDSLYEIKNL